MKGASTPPAGRYDAPRYSVCCGQLQAGTTRIFSRIIVSSDHGKDAAVMADDDDDDVFYCSCRNKIGAELHTYLEEGTYRKRLFRGPSTNDMKK